MIRYLLLGLMFVSSAIYAEPRIRPDTWGAPVIGTGFDNLYFVDKGLYRSEQPEHEDVSDLNTLGIKEVLNLREYHGDKDDIKDNGIVLHRIKMNAGTVTEEQLVDALRIIKSRKGPVLVHCWHGSDRTGVTIAAYRIVFNNWSKSQALDEMNNGGYGYHSNIYPNLVTLIENLNIMKIKNAIIPGVQLNSALN